MRLSKHGLLIASLWLLGACSLDFDRFGETKDQPDAARPDQGDGGSAPDAACKGPGCTTTPGDGGGSDAGDAGLSGSGGHHGSGGHGGSGGHDGSGGSGGPKGKAPNVHVVFPLAGITESSTITVRGSVGDFPNEGPFNALTVNGKAATLESDGRFSVSVPLALGKHALAIHVEGADGATADTDGPEIERLGYLFQRATDVVLDGANQRVIALDGATDAIVAIALGDGARTVITAASKTPVERNGLDLDAAHHRVIVSERNPGALAWIDLNTGKRTVISDATHGTGPAMVPHAVVLDRDMTGRAFVSAEGAAGGDGSDVVLAVDLATGNRTTFSQPGSAGNNTTSIGAGLDLVYDHARNQLIMVTYQKLLAVDLGSGALSKLATQVNNGAMGNQFGPSLFNPSHASLDGDRLIMVAGETVEPSGLAAFAIDLPSGHAHELATLCRGNDPQLPSRNDTDSPSVFDPDTGEVLALDVSGTLLRARLTPGDREFISDVLYGKGPAFKRPASVANDAGRGRWIVADSDLSAIIAVDQRSGDRSVISDASHGTGDAFETLAALDFNSSSDEIIALDGTHLWSVDPVSGDRTVIASDTVGTGPSFQNSRDFVVDEFNARAIVIGCYGNYPCGAEVLAIDLSTGNRTIISAQGVGTGPLPTPPAELTSITHYYDQYLVAGPDMLLTVNATNGNRSVISDGSTGSGPALMADMLGVAWDSYENRALVLNHYADLIAIDLATGDRTALADSSTTGRGPWPSFLGDVIVDLPGHRAIVAEGWNSNEAGLLGVQLADRARTLISAQGHNVWPSVALALDPQAERLYGALTPDVIDDNGPPVVSIDLRTMKLTTISDDRKNAGASNWRTPFGLALDAPGHRLFGISFPVFSPHISLLQIDIASGAQSVLGDATTGSGVGWSAPYDVAWSAEHERVVVTTALPAVVTIDPANGEREVLSGGPTGTGAAFTNPFYIALDPTHDRALVVDAPASPQPVSLIAVDLETGNRALISGAGAGSGPDLVTAGRMVVDSSGTHVFMLDSGNDTVDPKLISIALDDGARSMITPLPARWYRGASVNTAFAYDEGKSIVFAGQLFAIDTVSGDYVLIAGNAK